MMVRVIIDAETFEQILLTKEQIDSNSLMFLAENTPVTILFHLENPIEIRIPAHMNLKVVKTDPGEKGNTAQGGTKPATLETGIIINVPLFIQENELVRVDTRDKRYIERVK
jgi:elongation factor P